MDKDAQTTPVAEEAEETPATQPEVAADPESFAELMAEFPDIQQPDDLPEKVYDMAKQQDISLLDAFLRHRWEEEKRVQAEADRRAKAVQSTVGSLAGEPMDENVAQDAFLRAFRAAL